MNLPRNVLVIQIIILKMEMMMTTLIIILINDQERLFLDRRQHAERQRDSVKDTKLDLIIIIITKIVTMMINNPSPRLLTPLVDKLHNFNKFIIIIIIVETDINSMPLHNNNREVSCKEF